MVELLGVFFLLGILAVVAVAAYLYSSKLTPEQKEEMRVQQIYGALNPAMICPHCQTRGKIRTKYVTQKKGISGGKATAALLTGGTSLLVVGLSRKEGGTQAVCTECRNTWLF